MNEEAQERLSQIAPLQQGLDAAWTTFKPHLEKRKRELIAQLVAVNNDETRGRIKELDDLLGLPERLQQEAMSLQQPQQQEAELP